MDIFCSCNFLPCRIASSASMLPFMASTDVLPPTMQHGAFRGRASLNTAISIVSEDTCNSRASYAPKRPLLYVWKRVDKLSRDDKRITEENTGCKHVQPGGERKKLQKQQGNWVLKILHARSICPEDSKEYGTVIRDKHVGEGNESLRSKCACCPETQTGSSSRDDQELLKPERDSFSRLLKRVSLADARLYAQLSYLGSLAYTIDKIKPGDLLQCHGLKFVTSSLEKKIFHHHRKSVRTSDVSSEAVESSCTSTLELQNEIENSSEPEEMDKIAGITWVSPAYRILAAAASFLQSQTTAFTTIKLWQKDITKTSADLVNSSNDKADFEQSKSKMESFLKTTSPITAGIAAKEETKQAIADNLSAANSSPCEWFICDSDRNTRIFIIQGSESLASWQANLLFEPVMFEEFNVLVHRGIYEAAKGIYEQMLPEVRTYLKSRGISARLRFTGHSLGGSLALLVNLMLLARGEVPHFMLLPVVTFGSPAIMCGGDQLLCELGLPKNHIQAVVMHRDIVPRAFSCNYPDNVAELLMTVNWNFRNHPCLKNEKILYSLIGELLILQPEERFSPYHPLLPPGVGLYKLCQSVSSRLRAAQTLFLNHPHPLDILMDPSAYGSRGTILRNHDMVSYLRSLHGVINEEVSRTRNVKHLDKLEKLLVLMENVHKDAIFRLSFLTVGVVQWLSFTSSSGFKTARPLRSLSVLVSRCQNVLVLLLLPGKLLLGNVVNIIH